MLTKGVPGVQQRNAGKLSIATFYKDGRCITSQRMMTSSNGNIFRVTGPLCGEFTGPGEFPTQRPVTRSFDVFFDLRLNKRLSKQPWGWWFETPSWSLWRQCNGTYDAKSHYYVKKKSWRRFDVTMAIILRPVSAGLSLWLEIIFWGSHAVYISDVWWKFQKKDIKVQHGLLCLQERVRVITHAMTHTLAARLFRNRKLTPSPIFWRPSKIVYLCTWISILTRKFGWRTMGTQLIRGQQTLLKGYVKQIEKVLRYQWK